MFLTIIAEIYREFFRGSVVDKNLKSFLLIILTCFFIASRTSGTAFQEKSPHGTPAKPQKNLRSFHKPLDDSVPPSVSL